MPVEVIIEREINREAMIDLRPFQHLYPFAHHYAEIGGHRYHYLDEGKGPPVVMVHGNPTWSFYFRELVIALRENFRCIVPDHIGCGLSDKPDDTRYSYTLENRVNDLDALLSHLQIDEPIIFIVHDWGGMIGMACALRRIAQVRKLVILNTGAFLLPPGKKLPRRLKLLRKPNALATFAVQGLNAFAGGATWMATTRGLPNDVRAGLLAPYDTWANRRATLRFVQDIPLRPGHRSFALAKWVDDNLHRVAKLPALICWGGRDFVFDHHFLAEWKKRLPRADVHLFPDAGHYVLEDAREEVVALVKDFLRDDKSPAAAEERKEEAPIVNVAEHLRQAAKQNPGHRAIVWRNERGAYAHVSFADLDRQVDAHAHGLSRAGISRGARTILMVRPSLEFFVITFALYRIGAVPVLIDPGMGVSRMAECLRGIQAEAFIGVPKAQIFRLLNRASFRSIRTVITVGTRWFWGGHRLSDLRIDSAGAYESAPTALTDPAAIIFTTGSTGPPKAVLFEHGMFDAQVKVLRDYFRIQPGEVDLPTFPLFALFDPALGMTAVIPEMDPTRPADVDPTKIISAINDQQVTHMFGSPALLERVSRYGAERRTQLPSLRRVISAGAPVPPAVIERFAAMLPPDAAIHTPYGATEALPVACITGGEILAETRAATAHGAGTCVGRPVGDVQVRVIRISDEPIEAWSDDLVLPPGEIGEIAVKGPVVTRKYLTHLEANRLAKITDSAGFWHRMGDTGYFDNKGRLWFCGRKAHRVTTTTGTHFTDPCEGIFNAHPRVSRSALVGVGEPGQQRPVMCIQLNKGETAQDAQMLTAELLALAEAHEPTRPIKTILYHPAFPVDIRHNAKIFREKLAIWAAVQLA